MFSSFFLLNLNLFLVVSTTVQPENPKYVYVSIEYKTIYLENIQTKLPLLLLLFMWYWAQWRTRVGSDVSICMFSAPNWIFQHSYALYTIEGGCRVETDDDFNIQTTWVFFWAFSLNDFHSNLLLAQHCFGSSPLFLPSTSTMLWIISIHSPPLRRHRHRPTIMW